MSLSASFKRFSETPWAVAAVLVIALLVHLGFVFCNTFIADDFLQYFVFAGDEQLQALGFAGDKQAGTLNYALHQQFNFFDASQPSFQALKDYGVLPWWMATDASLHLWRPLTSLTHWLDYQLWPDSLTMMHVTSLVIVMLAWTLLAYFYTSISPVRAVAVLALLILIADISLFFPLIWLAARNVFMVMLCLALTLIFLQLSRERAAYLVLALAAFIGALLSAEAGVVSGGFVAAFLLFYDDRTLAKRMAILGAFVAVAIGWKLLYNSAGLGSHAVGNYIDPLQNPLHALLHCLKFYPLLLVNVFTGIDGLVSSWPLAILGWLLLMFFVLIALKAKDRLLRFSLAAVVLSLLPYVALYSSAPRFSVISHVAMALFLAQLLFINFQSLFATRWFSKLSRALVVLLVVIHLPLSLMAKTGIGVIAAGGNVFNSDNVDKKYNGFEDFDVVDKHIVVINAVDPFRMMFYPFRAAYHDQSMAKSARALVPAANSIVVQRIAERRLHIVIEAGLKLYGGDVNKALLQQNKAVNNRMFEFYGFFHDGQNRLSIGQTIDFEELSITITAVNDAGQVTGMDITLAHQNNDRQYLWLYWDWQADKYLPWQLPAVGETQRLKGQI